jgi:hypothetical protein
LSGSSPLTCLAWEALRVAYATVSIALGIMWPHKPHHYFKVGIPSGGITTDYYTYIRGLAECCLKFQFQTVTILSSLSAPCRHS